MSILVLFPSIWHSIRLDAFVFSRVLRSFGTGTRLASMIWPPRATRPWSLRYPSMISKSSSITAALRRCSLKQATVVASGKYSSQQGQQTPQRSYGCLLGIRSLHHSNWIAAGAQACWKESVGQFSCVQLCFWSLGCSLYQAKGWIDSHGINSARRWKNRLLFFELCNSLFFLPETLLARWKHAIFMS